MKKELDNQLCEKFPLLYRDRHGDKSKTLMCWGFACGDGWFDLIHDLSEKLETIARNDPEKRLKAVQVKEKFGTLRFYTNHSTDDIDACIEEAEERSAITCELCGDTGGKLRNIQGWYTTLCDKDYEEQKRERARNR